MEKVVRELKDEVVFMYENAPMCGVICGKTTFIGVRNDDKVSALRGSIHSSEEGYTKYHIQVCGHIIDLYEDQVFSTIEELKATLFSIIKK